MRSSECPVFAPPLVIEVLSPSNKEEEMQRRQHVAAFSGGTQEFWVIDLDSQNIEVSIPGEATRVVGVGDVIRVSVLPGALFPVDVHFAQ